MSLPEEKKQRLAKGIADDLGKEIRRHYKNLREHEVGAEDAFSIVRKGCQLTPIPKSQDLEKP